jgi:hypothetical protein
MNQFDRVAQEPRKGDRIKFSGGLLVYEAVTGFDGDPSLIARRITTHREAPYEREKSVPVQKDVWGDLVARAATVEQGP